MSLSHYRYSEATSSPGSIKGQAWRSLNTTALQSIETTPSSPTSATRISTETTAGPGVPESVSRLGQC